MADSWEPEIDEIRRRRQDSLELGGPDKIARQRAAGRSTVRERIESLLDSDSFEEIGQLAGFIAGDEDDVPKIAPTNFVFGLGEIRGRRVVVAGDDFTVRGGASDASIWEKQIDGERLANALRLPMIRLVEGTGGGGSVRALEDLGHTYIPVMPGWDSAVDNLSVVPVVAACMGPVAGLGAARVVSSHFSILIEGISQLFAAGPALVKHATGEDLDKESLGGSTVHRRSGAIDRIVADEAEALETIRDFLDYLPGSVFEVPPIGDAQEPSNEPETLRSVVPRSRRSPYRLAPILNAVFDAGSVFPLACYGGSVFTALARLEGHPVGLVATDPFKGATMSPGGADALVRLVDLCETFHLPIISLTDQSGMSIGLTAEKAGAIRRGARAAAAVYQARVPMAEVVVRRIFGVGGAGQVNRHRYSRQWAWPSGDWGSLPVEGGIEAAYKADLAGSDDPDQLLKEIHERLEAIRSPLRTAEKYGVPDIIDPAETRAKLSRWVRDVYRILPELLGRPAFGTRP